MSRDTLDRFVLLPENRSAHQAVQQLAAVDQRRVPLLFLHGPPGTGKSHLAAGLIERYTQTAPTKTARTVAAAEIGRALLQPPPDGPETARDIIACDLLVIEDLQHLPPAAGDQLAHILDRRQPRRRPVVVTAARGPAALDCSPRLCSRLVGGLVVAIIPLSEPSRRAIAAVLCREHGLKVTDDVVAWLARDPGGVRPILGEITRLEQLAKTHKPPLTLAVVSAELGSPAADGSPMERIVELVAGRFQVAVRAVVGPSRIRNVVRARHVAMYLGRQLGLPLAEIGRHLGGRDHSTVIHGCAMIEAAVTADTELATEVRDLRAANGSGPKD
ncbi:MAG TPA: helix-turn-helix domain-containing protein [Gemmataceae bacterium]|nr:helix-turn-helix domain-containing protein [Gemmataceae bacterium]